MVDRRRFGVSSQFRFRENTIGLIRCRCRPLGASKSATARRVMFESRDNLLLSSNRRNYMSGDMEVRDGAAGGRAEHEIATGTHVED